MVSPFIWHEVTGLGAMFFVFWMLSFKPAFSTLLLTFIKRLFSSSLISAIKVVLSAYTRLLIFLPTILGIPACASSSLAFHMMYSAYKLNKQDDNNTALTYSFPYLEPICYSMSSSNCCFLTCIQVSQESGKVVCYSHLLKNFLQFVVIHTVKGLSVVNEAEEYVFLDFSCFFYDPMDFGNLISSFSDFSKSSLYIWRFSMYALLKCSL